MMSGRLLKMKKIILILIGLILINSVHAQESCEYNGIKTMFGYNYQEPGKKAEYSDEQFILIADAKAVKSLEQIKGLKCLESADFYNQGISGNLENLKDLINLKVMNLHTNPQIEGDVCAFSKATKLKSLKLAFDEKVYGDISCLKDINVDTLAMTYTKISGDLSDLRHMTNLKALYLSGTDVVGDISALSGLTNLEELTLSDPEADGSQFYGDLASLENLKKLRRVAIYNTKAINCDHFTQMHPNIEGGCSEESKSAVINTNIESEKIIGKETGLPNAGLKDQESGDSAGPPERCIVDGNFIGENECRKMMEVPGMRTPEPLPETVSPETELPEEIVIKKSFLQKVIGWFSSLFK